MTLETQFIDLAQGAWAVFRVATVTGSVYLVGLHSVGGRRSAVVRGAPGTEKEHVVVRDTEPEIGSASLFDVPSSEWPGQRLRVATMETSPIASVTLVTDADSVTAVTGVVVRHPAGHVRAPSSPPPRSAPPPRPSTYPESHVRYAEDAAALLQAVHRRAASLARDLDAPLRARLELALTGCVLSLDGLRRALTEE